MVVLTDQSNAEQTNGDTQPAPIVSPAVLAIRHRRKSVKNRKGQLGGIEVKMTQSNRKMARIHYWDDVPGEHARKRRDTKWQDVTNWSDKSTPALADASYRGSGCTGPKEANSE